MTETGAEQADLLEALVSTIENATELHGTLVRRNSQAWIESAVGCFVPTQTIDTAAQRALDDTTLFAGGLRPTNEADDNVEGLRATALASVRKFQSTIIDAMPSSLTHHARA